MERRLRQTLLPVIRSAGKNDGCGIAGEVDSPQGHNRIWTTIEMRIGHLRESCVREKEWNSLGVEALDWDLRMADDVDVPL